MIRQLLAATTAIALSLLPMASVGPSAVAAGLNLAPMKDAEHPPDSAGKKDGDAKKGKKDKAAKACDNGSAPPCAAEKQSVVEQPQGPASGIEPAAESAQAGSEAEPGAGTEPASAAGTTASETQSTETAPSSTAPTGTTATETPESATTTSDTTASEAATSEPASSAPSIGPAGTAQETVSQPGQPANTPASDQPKTEAAESESSSQKSGFLKKTKPAATAEVTRKARKQNGDATASDPQPAEGSEVLKTGEMAAQEPVQAAAAAASETGTEGAPQVQPVAVTNESVTAETTRTSNEEVAAAKAERRKNRQKNKGNDDDNSDLLKIIGAAAGGLVGGVIIGSILNDGGEVVDTTGDRVIIERDGQYYVRKDEDEILRRPGSDVLTETFGDGSSRSTVEREDGTRVVTIRDQYGYVVRRSRLLPDGREILLFDDTAVPSGETPIEELVLPPLYLESLPHASYVEYSQADRTELHDTLMAPLAARVDRTFSLRQVRETRELRDLVPGLDLDAITFDTGSAAISVDQARKLDELGLAMEDILRDNPDEVFLIEGHTDAVGSRVMNLTLSDQRAETVALALTEYFRIPPENLFTQGYGEEFLKIDTEAAERANRRATVRRITPLLERRAALR